MLFLGMMIGSPLAGYISDICQRRSVPMLLGGVVLLGLMMLLLLVPGWGHSSLMVLFFLVGLFSGAQVIAYPAVSERAPASAIAMSVSVVNISVQSGQGIMKPLFGEVMHISQASHHHIGRVLSQLDYRLAMWLLPVLVVVAIIILMVSNPNSLKDEIKGV